MKLTGSIALVIMLLSAAVGAFLWPYSINTWLVFMHKPPSIAWWQGALIGFIPYIGQITIPVAFVTWILMLFLG